MNNTDTCGIVDGAANLLNTNSQHREREPESHTRNFARVSCVLVPDFSVTRNSDQIGSCSILYQKLGITCTSGISRRVLFTFCIDLSVHNTANYNAHELS